MGKTTGKQRIVIPTFDLYSKEIGDGNENEIPTWWRTLYATFLTKTTEKYYYSHIAYNHYQNKAQWKASFFNTIYMVLQNMAIVPIININDNDKEQVKKLFESSL